MSKRLPTTWVTRDKRRVKIKEMELSHLINLVQFLRRKAAYKIEREIMKRYALMNIDEMSEGVFDAIHFEIQQLEALTPDQLLREAAPIFLAVEKELHRRRKKMPEPDSEAQKLARLMANPLIRQAVKAMELKEEVRSAMNHHRDKLDMDEVMASETWGDS